MTTVRSFTKDDIKGIEVKHITVVNNKAGKEDLHVVKEIVHLKDNTSIPRLRTIENYLRPYWVTNKGMQNHKEKKDFEFEHNTRKYMSTQRDLINNVKKGLGIGFTQGWTGLKTLARSAAGGDDKANGQFLYGADVSSTCCLKYDYRKAYPDLITPNSVAGGDIETNVYEDDRDGEIICMSVSFKDQVYLAYLKRWVSDIADPVAETFSELQKIPELVELVKGRKLNIKVEVVDTPFDIVVNCMRKLHEWKPDFFSFWNMDFDMSRILKAIEYAGIDPALVFSDPSIPNNYKYFHYKRDDGRNISSSGVNKSKSPEDQWHWVTAPASFQCIDAMSTYRITRLAGGKDASYSLDNILKKELYIEEVDTIETLEDLIKVEKAIAKVKEKRPGSYAYLSVSDPKDDVMRKRIILNGDDEEETIYVNEPTFYPVDSFVFGDAIKPNFRTKYIFDYGKLKFPEVDHLKGIEWHKEMQLNNKIKYGLYNIIDSIRLEQLDEHTNDLASNITLYSKYSDYKNFNSNPKRLCDDMHFWYQERPEPCVISTSSDEQSTPLDKFVINANSWIITLPSYMMAPVGLKCIKEFPNYHSNIFCHICD